MDPQSYSNVRTRVLLFSGKFHYVLVSLLGGGHYAMYAAFLLSGLLVLGNLVNVSLFSKFRGICRHYRFG